MKKIPTVYLRDNDDRSKITEEVNPECLWVIAGEGKPTPKYNGTCVMLDADVLRGWFPFGRWWARREDPDRVAVDT